VGFSNRVMKSKKFGIGLAALILASVVAPAAHADLNVPTTSFPACTDATTSYCIQAVSVTDTSGKTTNLTYNSTGATTGILGSWSDAAWGAAEQASSGYNGLFVSARAANQYVSHIFVDAQPVIANGGSATLATQKNNAKYPVDLDPNTTISVTIRTGGIKVGATIGVGINESVKTTYGSAYSTVQITGDPVPVALAGSTKDCTGQSGVAVANANEFQAVILVENDTYGFGVDSASGNMVVSSNGTCNLSTPVWNADSKKLTWGTSAPYFETDGKTANQGFYTAIIPFADVTAYWGLTRPQDASSALTVSISTNQNGSQAAVADVSARNGVVVISATGFDFAAPILTIGLNTNYKPSTVGAPATTGSSKAPAATGTVAKSGKATLKTITCVKGKSTKSVTAANPICPNGYTKK